MALLCVGGGLCGIRLKIDGGLSIPTENMLMQASVDI